MISLCAKAVCANKSKGKNGGALFNEILSSGHNVQKEEPVEINNQINVSES